MLSRKGNKRRGGQFAECGLGWVGPDHGNPFMRLEHLGKSPPLGYRCICERFAAIFTAASAQMCACKRVTNSAKLRILGPFKRDLERF
jgi:hypothetical protein